MSNVKDFDKKVNTVIKEPDKHTVTVKEKVVNLTVSLGADPKQKLN